MKKYEFTSERKTFRTTESYKTLRTNLLLSGSDIKVVVITSCSPGDGKSYVTQNLAVNLAQTKKRVLLIDADLRKSALIGKITVEGKVSGLSHLLAGQATYDDVILQNKTFPSLYTIVAGTFPPDPAELIASDNFKSLIEKAREEFDYVLIDTPPLGSVIDSAIAATVSDGIIMVIRAQKTSYRFAKGVKDQLEKTGCRILGAVLNGVDVEDRNNYYYKNYKDYYYSDYRKYY